MKYIAYSMFGIPVVMVLAAVVIKYEFNNIIAAFGLCLLGGIWLAVAMFFLEKYNTWQVENDTKR